MKQLPSNYYAAIGGVSIRCLSVDQHGQIFETNHNIIDLPVIDNALRDAQQQHAAAIEVFGTDGVFASVAFVSDIEDTVLAAITDNMVNALRDTVRGVLSQVAVAR